MKKSKFTDEQIAFALKQVELSAPICRLPAPTERVDRTAVPHLETAAQPALARRAAQGRVLPTAAWGG